LDKKYLVFALIAFLISFTAVSAAISYASTLNFTVKEYSFTVDLPTTIDLGLVEANSTTTRTWTVTNTGNTAINVTASASTTSGAQLSWDKTSAEIPAGWAATYVLTITFPASGSGTINVQFDKVN